MGSGGEGDNEGGDKGFRLTIKVEFEDGREDDSEDGIVMVMN